MHRYKGAIMAYVGPMFGGKTSALLSQVKKMRIARYNVGLFKPIGENRYSKEEVVNHDGESLNAIRVETLPEILEICSKENFNVIAIDEFQFIRVPDYDYIATFIEYIIKNKITLVVSCLDLDSDMVPFNMTKELLPYCTHIFKEKAVCIDCGNDASLSFCKIKKTAKKLIGGKDAYDPLCISCYLERKEASMSKH